LAGANLPLIVGPTGVGKTAVALALARHWPLEVVSADSRQVYRRLDIGTAKPTPRERARLPHHGLDLVDPGERYSAGRFARDASGWIQAIRDRDRRDHRDPADALLELLVRARLELLIVAAAFRARLEVRILLAELLLCRRDQTEIMFGMLKIVLGRDRIAGGLGIACELEIFLRHVIGRSANLHIRAVRLVNPRQGILIAPVVLLMIIAPAHPLVVMMLLTVSHGLLFNDS